MAGGVLATQILSPIARPMKAGTFAARRSDDRLAALVAEGNQQAFAVLYERYHQQLYRYCRSILHHDGDAQDALQSTMTAALAALRRGVPRAPLRPWLYRIAHNESISLIRERGKVQQATSIAEPVTESAEERAGERARFAQLMADLSALPERQRAALLMHELSGLSHDDIALALDTSPGASRQLIFDARRALSAFASGRAMQCEEVRRMVSDGDGRMLRAHNVRAHVRDCAGCHAFATSIKSRRVALNAVVPLLGPAAAAKLLARVLGAGSARTAAASSVGGASVISAKLLVGAAILAGGVTTLVTTQNLPATQSPRMDRQTAIALPPLTPLSHYPHLLNVNATGSHARPQHRAAVGIGARVAGGGPHRQRTARATLTPRGSGTVGSVVRKPTPVPGSGSASPAPSAGAAPAGNRGRHLDRGAAQNHLGVGPPKSHGVGPPAGKGNGPASTRSAGSRAAKP